jgi:hypothetical protein
MSSRGHWLSPFLSLLLELGGRGRSEVMVGDDAEFRAGGGGEGDILHGSYGAD